VGSVLRRAYFRIARRQMATGSSSMIHRLMNAVVTAGGTRGLLSMRERWAWFGVLFDTGCRLHEACPPHYWRTGSIAVLKELVSINKGIFTDVPYKRLLSQDRRSRSFQRYWMTASAVRSLSAQLAPLSLKAATRAPCDIPLFLTKRGNTIWDPITFGEITGLPH